MLWLYLMNLFEALFDFSHPLFVSYFLLNNRRITFALARDNAFPFSSWVKKINATFLSPVNALLFVWYENRRVFSFFLTRVPSYSTARKPKHRKGPLFFFFEKNRETTDFIIILQGLWYRLAPASFDSERWCGRVFGMMASRIHFAAFPEVDTMIIKRSTVIPSPFFCDL